MEKKSLGKRPRDEYLNLDDDTNVYKFKVLLPNGTTVELTLSRSEDDDMNLEEFINEVRYKYERTVGAKAVKGRRRVIWKSPAVYLEDFSRIKITKVVDFRCFAPNKYHFLRLHDGVKDIADKFENMWDLTPDTDMLMELPAEYTFETALADLIDNSLQAVWSNDCNEKRLVSVTIDEHGITIFDTGPGMDGNDKNSIVKWGKMGASLHRSARGLAIGGKPPYLTPSFGMFGYGGFIASMHLGRHALVSSRTKDSKKVYTLHLEREALLRSDDKTWKTDGGIRDPLEDEISSSPHGSFTKVEISELKEKRLDTAQLKCRLKDIYFPYIQCDEMLRTGRTSTPIQFQVNGEDLAELEGGEVAITNMLSCNGPEFVLQLHFSINEDAAAVANLGSSASQEAHARLKCVYFPIVEGKESIDRILEKLKAEGFKVADTFDTFPRASIRRLGRLLPEARWGRLPFMEPRQRKGDRAQVLKRCCMRVKCFIDTDAGFNPTPSKTDLAHQHPCNIALRNFGNKLPEKERDIRVEILRGGKTISISQLEREYEDWVFQMHDKYDEEIACGEDPPVLVLCPHNKKGLGISSDVVRVHKVIKRKGQKWKSGLQIKILKGAVGCHKNNIYATLEYILLEGLADEACGEARLICRPLNVLAENGCLLKVDSTNTSLDIRGSLSFPISIIDSGKCIVMEPVELKKQLEKLQLKVPSTIDILSAQECHQLAIDKTLAFDAPVHAGNPNVKKIIAVLRPACYSPSSCRSLDQKFIIKDDLEMTMEVTFRGEDDGSHEMKHLHAERIKPSALGGFQGLYIFSVGSQHINHFQKSGIYKFLFIVNCEDSSCKKCEKSLIVLPETKVCQWRLLSDEKGPPFHVRVGSDLPCVSVACVDRYGNRMPFMSTPKVMVKLELTKTVISNAHRMKVSLSSNKLILNISDIWIESNNLDSIRPQYKTTLVICSEDDSYCVHFPCKVTPGPFYQVRAVCMELEKHLLPGSVIKKLVLEILDRFGNHVERGVEVSFNVDGLSFLDHRNSIRVVDDKGYIDLSGVLKVKAGYGKIVSLSVNNGEVNYYKEEFLVEKRMLRIVSVVPEYCFAGSQLEDIIFEIVDSEGVVDETIHNLNTGKPHTLKITSEFPGIDDSLQYSFCHGRCTVRSIPIPREEGVCSILAAHSNHPELCTNFQVHVMRPQESLIESFYEHEDFVPSQCSNRRMLLLQDSSDCLSNDNQILVKSMNDAQFQKLEDDIHSVGMRIGEHEKTLKLLSEKKENIEQGICHLQARIEPQELSQLDYINEKEGTVRQIEGKANTAASVVSVMMKYLQSQGLKDWGLIGVVALLGTVANNNLSRIFAEYLGEDQMLAVVCKSYASGANLEKYQEHGEVDHREALHAVAAELQKSINGRFLVICLEETSPYMGKIESDDAQGKLALPVPLLPTGKTPPGFLGYAVNMINLDADYLNTRTARGHGLRETLFYLLFGELQVYETREKMKNAFSSIKHGAVSLDGGIMRGNGIISLGAWEPDVRFPVASSEVLEQPSRQNMYIAKEITLRKLDLEATCDEIERERKALSELLIEFQVKKAQYQAVLEALHLAYNQNINVKTETTELD